MAAHKCVTINVNGLHDSVKRQNIFETFKRFNYDIIALQETRCDAPCVAQWKEDWGYQSCWTAGPNDSRGVALLFGRDAEVEVLAEHPGPSARSLRVDVRINGVTYQLINVYGPTPSTEARSESFFFEVSDLMDPDFPPIVFGDFNMVHDLALDRKGGNPRNFHKYGLATLTSHIINPFELVDIWRHQHPQTLQFTFHRFHDNIHSRLDRIYIPFNMADLAVSSFISDFIWSDHDVCGVNMLFKKQVEKGPGYFKLNLSYLDHPAYVEKISSFWRSWQGQKAFYPDITTWWELGKVYVRQISVEHAASIHSHRRDQKQELSRLLAQERAKASAADPTQIFIFEDQLRDIEVEANQKIFHHAHIDVREIDERPTRFFYSVLAQAQQKSAISAVTADDGSVITDQHEVRAEIKRFYERLFKRDTTLSPDYQKFFLGKIKRKLSARDRALLDSSATTKELYDALVDAKKGKVPGYDGLPYEFYLTFWALLKDDLLQLINHLLFVADKLGPSQGRSIITLLYKRGDVTRIRNWRPVSLLCCDYKLITKILNNRLKGVLDTVISPSQQSGISGRTIFNNLHLMRDVIDYCENQAIPGYILSIDQEKAFDKVDRDFLYAVLERMGFGPRFIRAVQVLYTDNVAHVLVNGFVSDSFTIERSAKQGCPMSSNLYAIYIEPLALAIQEEKALTPLPLPGPPILIMQIADDMEIFLSEKASMAHLFRLFRHFRLATGSTINEEKTEGLILGWPSTASLNQSYFDKVKWMNSEGLRVLGVIFFLHYSDTQEHNWAVIIEELKVYIQQSKARDLSLKGRTLVLNTLVLSRVWYLATVISPPAHLVNPLIRLLIDFLWQLSKKENKCIDPIQRLVVYQPLSRGGLNLKNFPLQVQALQLKFIRDITNPDCTHPWVHLARYWIGFRMGALSPDWAFLRNNDFPRLIITGNIHSSFYKAILRIGSTLEIPRIIWTTRDLYQYLHLRIPVEPKCWKFWQGHGATLKRLFSHVHWTDAKGRHQDVHFKWIHQIHPTNHFRFHRFTGGDNFRRASMFCVLCPTKAENHWHCFHKCHLAVRIWNVVWPTIRLLMRTDNFTIVRLLTNTYAQNVRLCVRRMITTILQIALHTIWINRNSFVKDSVFPSLNLSLARMRLAFNKCVRKRFADLPLAKFREFYCHTPQVCRVVGNTRVVVDLFPLPAPPGEYPIDFS